MLNLTPYRKTDFVCIQFSLCLNHNRQKEKTDYFRNFTFNS